MASVPAEQLPSVDISSPMAPPPRQNGSVFSALGNEASRYGSDSIQLVTAPFRWESDDWKRAAAFGVVLGGLFLADESIQHAAQNHRSSDTNSVSSAVQPLGGWGAVTISAGLVVAGLAGGGDRTLQTGRDAVEATIFTGIVTNLIVKPAAGRVRPNGSNGETAFEPASKNASFPSGDVTEAFAVASVIGARSDGWVIPTVAYAAATLVGFERINLNVHFASDVFAGAVFGTVVGHFLVHRHQAEENATETSSFDMDVSASPGGMNVRLRF